MQRPGTGTLPPLNGSPPPPTAALLIALGIAASATVTGSVTLDAPPAASTDVLVQVTVWPLTVQLQSPYLPAAVVMPAGISSTNVIAPVVATVPLFVTVNR